MAMMKSQPTQHAIVKVRENPPQRVRIATVNPFSRDPEKLAGVKQISLRNQARYYLAESEIRALIEERKQALEQQTDELIGPTSFRE